MNTQNFVPRGKVSCERGYLLLFLCPLLLLALLFLVGTVEVISRTQRKVALQSRLDICAVELSVDRKKLFEHLASTNDWLRITGTGIAMARGAMILGGPAGVLFGKMGEQALLLANRATALEQDLRIHATRAKELMRVHCRATNFSRESAFCAATPSLVSALRRNATLFFDVKGAVEFRSMKTELTKVRCHTLSLRTEIRLTGDPTLTKGEVREAYSQ
ncbi:MAG: hypothetical protein AB7K68_13470 [Bacteriovoracia bacterium]